MQRIAELNQRQAEINPFRDQHRRLTIVTKAEVIQNDMRGRREIVFNFTQGEMPFGFVAHPTAKPACTPLCLQQYIDHDQGKKQQ